MNVAVAGAGTGSLPCVVWTVPDPTFRGELMISVMPRCSIPMTDPTMSTSASTAPTSWKWTRSGVVPWTFASTSASR